VEVALAVTTLAAAEFDDMDVIPSPSFRDRMQRLMNIANEMHKKLESLNAIPTRCMGIGKHARKHFYTVDNAIAMVSKS
jgi:hypothetical protein